MFGTKEEMKAHAAERIADLKSRGFANAGLYDPPGVGGTHVMYVLHHADKPAIYAGLPDDPRISPLVEPWKGVTKYAGLAVMGIAAAASVFHIAIAGRNRVTAEDDEEARRRRMAAAPIRPGRGAAAMTDGALIDVPEVTAEIDRGDHRVGKEVMVDRYTTGARINHWITATSLILLALSGLALFHP